MPILLLPGSWHGAWCWNEVVAHLVPDGRPTLVVDMAGHGLRARRPECLTTRSFDPAGLATEVSPVTTVDLGEAADLLVSQIRHLGRGGPVTVVAHSMGGPVLTRVAQQVPDLVAHAVYLAAVMPASGKAAGPYFALPENAGALVLTALRGDPEAIGALRLDLASNDPAYRQQLRDAFYGDVAPHVADAALGLLTPETLRPAGHGSPGNPANHSGHRTSLWVVAAGRLHRVAVLVLEGAKPLDVGIPAQVFTTRASMPYEVRVCGAAPGLVTGGDGLSYHVADGLDALAWAEIIFVPGYRFPDREDPPRVVVDALVAAHERGARLAAISTGAFALAATGLLDGRRATTHWHYTRALKEKHPAVRVDENVLFVDEGSVLTSAGAASGIDLCLHILRGDLGVGASNHAARRLVAAPYRSGGQAQYVPRSVPEPLGERFAVTREWALHRLDKPLTLETLARHAAVSPRTFSRRFVEDTGYTPMQWVLRARIDLARELLERSQRSVEQIAADVGLGTGANLRLHFQRILGTTPSEYRRTFAPGEQLA